MYCIVYLTLQVQCILTFRCYPFKQDNYTLSFSFSNYTLRKSQEPGLWHFFHAASVRIRRLQRSPQYSFIYIYIYICTHTVYLLLCGFVVSKDLCDTRSAILHGKTRVSANLRDYPSNIHKHRAEKHSKSWLAKFPRPKGGFRKGGHWLSICSQ